MSKLIDLNQHFSITSAKEVRTITAPLSDTFGIKHFRYLKLFQDKSRVLLSDFPDCTKFVYEDGTYQKMWFDGEFLEGLTPGCHLWEVHRGDEKTPFEHEINKSLGLYHGLTFVYLVENYWEIYTFDSDSLGVYHLDKRIFTHFITYFKEQAAHLIAEGESEKTMVPNLQGNIEIFPHKDKSQLLDFLINTRVKRYYLGGKYRDIYLTSKEAQCVYWLIEGKSADEIATIENNSIKTINRHLENVRTKLNCYKQTQLIKIILESSIFETLNLYNG
jgi:DNA-binding CsgD family transcriptional regulator